AAGRACDSPPAASPTGSPYFDGQLGHTRGNGERPGFIEPLAGRLAGSQAQAARRFDVQIVSRVDAREPVNRELAQRVERASVLQCEDDGHYVSSSNVSVASSIDVPENTSLKK